MRDGDEKRRDQDQGDNRGKVQKREMQMARSAPFFSSMNGKRASALTGAEAMSFRAPSSY